MKGPIQRSVIFTDGCLHLCRSCFTVSNDRLCSPCHCELSGFSSSHGQRKSTNPSNPFLEEYAGEVCKHFLQLELKLLLKRLHPSLLSSIMMRVIGLLKCAVDSKPLMHSVYLTSKRAKCWLVCEHNGYHRVPYFPFWCGGNVECSFNVHQLKCAWLNFNKIMIRTARHGLQIVA